MVNDEIHNPAAVIQPQQRSRNLTFVLSHVVGFLSPPFRCIYHATSNISFFHQFFYHATSTVSFSIVFIRHFFHATSTVSHRLSPPFCFLSFNFYCIPRRLSHPFFFHATSTVSHRLSQPFCFLSCNFYCFPKAFSAILFIITQPLLYPTGFLHLFCFLSRNLYCKP